jgi:hypothetical protein
VFATLPALLLPAGRVLVEVAGKGEAALAQRWLRESGLPVVGAEQTRDQVGFRLVAEATPTGPAQDGRSSDAEG